MSIIFHDVVFPDHSDTIKTQPTTTIDYTASSIDEYIVIVNLPEDWETIHNYIIN